MRASPTTFLLLLLLVTAGADMARAVPDGPTSLLLSWQWLFNAIILFGWCKAHARERGVASVTLPALLSGLFPPVGVPFYFYRAFGYRQGTIKTLKSLLFFLLLIVVGVLAETIGRGNA